MKSMPSSIENKNAYNIWAQTYDNDRPPHTYLEEADFLQLLNANKNDVILDAACGTGRYTQILADLGAQVYACDLSDKMIQFAKTKSPHAHFSLVDLNEPLPFEDQKFSKVMCSLSIRHVENMHGFVAEAYRVLKPGGVFLFSGIHNDMDWKTYERANPPPIDLNVEGVTFSYGKAEFEEALKKTPFIIKEMREIRADERVKPFLTEASFKIQNGRKFVLVVLVSKPK